MLADTSIKGRVCEDRVALQLHRLLVPGRLGVAGTQPWRQEQVQQQREQERRQTAAAAAALRHH